jgi:molybdopterin synthase sulfur carrier subunit
MSVQVKIPTSLRRFTEGQENVALKGETVGVVLGLLRDNYPDLGGRLFDDQGGVRRFVNVYLNEDDIRFLKQLDTPVVENDEISIIPAIAGGC